jgi:hypothetical protein
VPAPEPLARLTEASRSPGLILVRVDDLAAVLALLRAVAEERDVLRQMVRRR